MILHFIPRRGLFLFHGSDPDTPTSAGIGRNYILAIVTYVRTVCRIPPTYGDGHENICLRHQ